MWRKRQLGSVTVASCLIYAIKSTVCFTLQQNPPHPSEEFIIVQRLLVNSTGSVVTEWRADAVAFAVNEPPHFCQVTVLPGDVIDRGGLHEEGVVRLHHPLNPVVDRFHQRRARPAAHEGPHLLKRRNL